MNASKANSGAARAWLNIRIAILPILLGLVGWIEIHEPVALFRLLSLILVSLFLAVAASLLRGGGRDALVALASLGFGLCIIETAAYLLEGKDQMVVTEGWSVVKPVIGWGPQHAGRFHATKTDPDAGTTIYDVDYTIDSNLIRQTLSRDSGPTIVFFGDSFTFGLGVNDPDTLPQLFADAIDRNERVLNLGNGGYGPQQFLRELQTGLFDTVIGPQPRLFIFTTAVWHAERTACNFPWVWHAPRYAIENDQVVFKGECYEGGALAFRQWLEHSAAYRKFAEPLRRQSGADDIELYIRIVGAAVELAREKYGVPTLIPYMEVLPAYLAGTGFSDATIIERLRKTGASVINVSLADEEAAGVKIKIQGDGHPTPLANRLRAAMLKSYIETHFPDVLASSSNSFGD